MLLCSVTALTLLIYVTFYKPYFDFSSFILRVIYLTIFVTFLLFVALIGFSSWGDGIGFSIGVNLGNGLISVSGFLGGLDLNLNNKPMIAGIVIFSRVYIGVHYPSDVISGWLIGTVYGLLLIKSWGYFNRDKP